MRELDRSIAFYRLVTAAAVALALLPTEARLEVSVALLLLSTERVTDLLLALEVALVTGFVLEVRGLAVGFFACEDLLLAVAFRMLSFSLAFFIVREVF